MTELSDDKRIRILSYRANDGLPFTAIAAKIDPKLSAETVKTFWKRTKDRAKSDDFSQLMQYRHSAPRSGRPRKRVEPGSGGSKQKRKPFTARRYKTKTADSRQQQQQQKEAATTTSLTEGKRDVRKRVWDALLKVARPDSRFHFDFSSFIPDFEDSDRATDRLVGLPIYQTSAFVFITPDNCLEDLRHRALVDGKAVLITTYAIRRGFLLLDPNAIGATDYRYAATLDGMEKLGQHVTLSDMVARKWSIPLMITGTGAISTQGVRFGKGHGFFDLEWAMMYTLGIVSQETVAVAVVHDCQVLDEELRPEVFDTVCDFVVTPTRVLEVRGAVKPTCGILWPLLQAGMLEDIPPLQELKTFEVEAGRV